MNSPKFEVLGELTDLRCAPDEQRTRQGSTERVDSAILVCDGDHTVQGAHLFYGEQPSGDKPTLSQVGQQPGGLISHTGDEDALTCRRRRKGERPVRL